MRYFVDRLCRRRLVEALLLRSPALRHESHVTGRIAELVKVDEGNLLELVDQSPQHLRDFPGEEKEKHSSQNYRS
jgi:hypothetical protein